MSELGWRIGILSFIILITINILWLDWQFIQSRSSLVQASQKLNQVVAVLEMIDVAGPSATDQQAASVTCDNDCIKQVSNLVEIEVAELLDEANLGKPIASTNPVNTSATNGIQYVPVGGNGSTKELQWVDIPSTETTVDWRTYGLNYTVTWDALLHVHQGNGSVSARLYDTTQQSVVLGSEITTTSQDDVRVTSGKLTLPTDTRTYIVQVKSLTSYEAFYRDGRIIVDIE